MDRAPWYLTETGLVIGGPQRSSSCRTLTASLATISVLKILKDVTWITSRTIVSRLVAVRRILRSFATYWTSMWRI